ncbi:MAG TPA: phosphoribosyltransferase [Allosphingosinicella sp.]
MRRHRRYEAAKTRADAEEAVNLCYEVADEQLMLCLDGEFCGRNPPPLIVAPSVAPEETNNALARTYAAWLADQLDGELATDIIQVNTAVKRDFITERYARLVQEPEFEGPVVAGRDYILADDVCTSGGTLASLRGFIENNGGRVIFMTSLATGGGADVQVSLAPATRDEVYGAYDGGLAELVLEELGYEAECLTEAEARYLLDRASLEAIRKGVASAKAAGA